MDDIVDFLKINFDKDISEVKPISGGERSKAFLFESNGKKYIFRENKRDIGFKKDKYAYNNCGKIVPIPKIIKIGQFEDRYYAISDFCKGKSLEERETRFSNILIENLIITLDRIHSISIPDGGYGVIDINGKTTYKSWSDWVLKNNTPVTRNDGSFYSWEDIKNIAFVDKAIINKLFEEIKKMLPHISNNRYLIHGDFATGNVIIDGDEVTGVIDWNESGYGDFLYDVAWLDFWIKKTDFAKAYKIHSQNLGINIPDYEKRIKCHQLFIGLTALGIYAAIDLEKTYLSTLDRIKSIIDL